MNKLRSLYAQMDKKFMSIMQIVKLEFNNTEMSVQKF